MLNAKNEKHENISIIVIKTFSSKDIQKMHFNTKYVLNNNKMPIRLKGIDYK